MGTAGRLTAEAEEPTAETPGLLPALEAGRTLTFRQPWGYRASLLIAGLLLSAFGVWLLAFSDRDFSAVTWEAGWLLLLALAAFGFGSFALYLAIRGAVVSLSLDERGIEILYAGSQIQRLRWDEITKVERYWSTGVGVRTQGGRRILALDTNMDQGAELLGHLQGVAWLNQSQRLLGRSLPQAVRETVRAGALQFRPANQVPALRRRRWFTAATPLLFAAALLPISVRFLAEDPWSALFMIAAMVLWPAWEGYSLWKFLTGYDSTIELTRRGLIARRPKGAETRLSWEQLAGAELDDHRRGIEILAPSGRIGVGELEHETFFWDVLGLLREDLREEIYDFAFAG